MRTRLLLLASVVSVAVLAPASATAAPVEVPRLNDAAYQALVREALRRVPVHNPEWQNFNEQDATPLRRDFGLPVIGTLITLTPGQASPVEPCDGCVEID